MKYFLNPKNTRILQMDAFFLQLLGGLPYRSYTHPLFLLKVNEKEVLVLMLGHLLTFRTLALSFLLQDSN